MAVANHQRLDYAGLGARAHVVTRPWLLLAAIALVAIGLGLLWIARANTDLPPIAELIREAREVYLPALRGESFTPGALFDGHTPGERAWKLGWLELNGQWDARLLSVASLGLQVAALVGLLVLVGRGPGARWIIGIAVATFLVIAQAPITSRPVASAANASMLAALSLWHLALMTRMPARAWIRGFGFAIGVLNLLWATAGIASAATLVVWSGLAMVRKRGSWRHQSTALALNGGLLVFGIGLWIRRELSGQAKPAADSTLPDVLSWPFDSPLMAIVVWAPGIFAIWRYVRAQDRTPTLTLVALLGMWSLVQAIVLGSLHVSPQDVSDVLVCGLLANALGFAALPATDSRSATRHLVLFGLWGIAVGNALLHPPPERVRVFAGPFAGEPVAVGLRRAVFEGNVDDLRFAAKLNEADAQELLQLVSQPELRRILPDLIRPPLAIAQDPAISRNFEADAAPELRGRDAYPAFGTWRPDGSVRTGVLVSQPLETKAPLLQLRVAGELRPPETSLVLRTTNGEEIAPLDGAFVAEGRWKRVNFPAPTMPFQIVAKDESPELWLAFTAPQEVGRGSWLVGKIVRAWAWWLAAGLLLGFGVLCRAVGRTKTVEAPAPPPATGINWAIAPWLALLAYVVFFSNHIDPTAGPNDSGGYLNSAKNFVEGRIAGLPRMIWGPAAGETDITPYVPITFFPMTDGRLAPEYPAGFPLVLWLAAQFTSLEKAVPAVILLQLVLGVFFTRQLARAAGLSDAWAWLAAGVIGLSPVYLFQGLQPQSDGPALVWVTAAIYWAWTSREKPNRAILAGLATALAVLIRPSNVLCMFPLLICLVGAWRQLAYWALAGLPGALWLMWYNRELFGSPFTTGYGDFTNGFGPQYVLITLRSYGLWLPVMFTPLVVLGFFGPFARAVPLRLRLMLTTWVAAFMVFYAFYWCTWDNWYNMRFVMPAAPAMVLLGVCALRQISERAGLALFSRGSAWRSIVPSTALVLVLLGFLVVDIRRREVLHWMHANHFHGVAARWAGENFPRNAVVFAKHTTNSLVYYTDLLIVRSDHSKAKTPEFFERIAATGRPIFAFTFYWETRGGDSQIKGTSGYPDLPGRWERIAVVIENEIYAWRWHPN